MNQRQRDALILSIAHWKENLRKVKDNHEPAIFGEDCECCIQFYECEKCPIANYNDCKRCYDTPWESVEAMYHREKEQQKANWTLLVPAVQEELDFLREVLENG